MVAGFSPEVREFEPSVGVSECRQQCRSSVEQCKSSVGAVWGQCRLTLVSECRRSVEQCRSSVGAVSEQCRPVSGILDSGPPFGQCRAVSECRSVGVSECRVGVRWVIVSSSDEVLWIWMS